MDDSKVYILVLVLGVASIVFGIYILYLSIKANRLITKSQSWNKTKGKIVKAKLAHEIDNDNNSMRFHLIKEYEYTVGGKLYRCNQRFASDRVMSFMYKPKDEKERKIKKLATFKKLKHKENRYKIIAFLDTLKGDDVQVHYDPSNPEKACMHIHKPISLYGQYVGGVIVLAVGIVLLYLLLNRPIH